MRAFSGTLSRKLFFDTGDRGGARAAIGVARERIRATGGRRPVRDVANDAYRLKRGGAVILDHP